MLCAVSPARFARAGEPHDVRSAAPGMALPARLAGPGFAAMVSVGVAVSVAGVMLAE